MSATTGPDAANPRDLREYDGGTVYVVHLDPPYRHARHCSGNPGSSAFLMVACGVHGRGLAELTGSAWVVGRSASGEGWQQVRVSQRWADAGPGPDEASAVQFLLDEPQCLGEYLRAGHEAQHELAAEPLSELEDGAQREAGPMTAPLPASGWGTAGVARAGPSARGCRLRPRALAAMKHGPDRIARALGDGTSTRAVQRIRRGQTKEIPARQLARISRPYEAWWDLTPPDRTPDERAAAAAARRRARRNRWCTGMGRDDDLLDEPGYDPHCAWRPAIGTGVATDNPLKVRRPYR